MNRVIIFWLYIVTVAAVFGGSDLEKARDAQDRGALDRLAAGFSAAAQKQPGDAVAQYNLAVAESYVAEVAIEVRDKGQAHSAAEAGIRAAERATSLKPESAEYHRVYGTLCGQAISANILQGMKYGHCAQDEVNKAVQLDPKSAINYVSRGVGNYYLPQGLGGGIDLAIKDFQKAIELDPQSPDAHLWLGLALRKVNRNAEARKEFQKSTDLNPARAWAKQQLDKTPTQ
jgi:tetratricopeptide (TPR) repeat protein